MSDDFKVDGADAFLALSKRLKVVDKELRKELNKGIRASVKTLQPKTRAAALALLPQSGGLAARVSKAKQQISVKTGANSYGVRLAAGQSGSGAYGADRGTVRHPVFGNRDRFVSQGVAPGWFSDTAKEHAPEVREELVKAMMDVAKKLAARRG